MNTSVEPLLRLSIKTSLFAAFAMVFAILMSFMAESLQQEIGYPKCILGYNRDFLVNGR